MAKAFSVNSVLKSAQKSGDSKKKSAAPLLTVTDYVKKIAAEILSLKTEVEDLSSTLDLKNAELIGKVRPLRNTYIKDHEFVSSVKVPTTDGMSLTIVFSGNYVKCGPENEESIINLIGQDRYNNYFNVTNTIKVKSDLSNEKLEELIKKVGATKFAEYFEVDTNIKPNERFQKEQLFNFTEDEIDELELVGVKAYKPSIKK